jgi:hypothetical protein
MSYVVPKCHVGWFRPSLCATWHGLGLTYVACPMPCLDAMWHGLAYVPCGIYVRLKIATWHLWIKPSISAMLHGLGLSYVRHVMFRFTCKRRQCHMSPNLG